ncbi:hypothetical protein L484_019885 [Morus notabilis]|uniref:Uncharacterized protein n=1 Tax=Morus notabilis TaxID=981085 RepID=W9SY65_9ROSA|nr:hypothetical protein L484_019885 [Morus notabilis]
MAILRMSIAPPIFSSSRISPSSSTSTSPFRFLKPARCAPAQQVQQQEQEQQQSDAGILCEPCNGRGWLVCDFCKGQKTNVKADNKRIYRRCPSCRAVLRFGNEEDLVAYDRVNVEIEPTQHIRIMDRDIFNFCHLHHVKYFEQFHGNQIQDTRS